MLGSSKKPEPKTKSESLQSSPGGHNRFSKLKAHSSPSSEGRDRDTDPSFSTPKRSTPTEDELSYRSPQSTVTTTASRRSRRGSQPSGSEVKQVNGFTLNPAAKEFYPTT